MKIPKGFTKIELEKDYDCYVNKELKTYVPITLDGKKGWIEFDDLNRILELLKNLDIPKIPQLNFLDRGAIRYGRHHQRNSLGGGSNQEISPVSVTIRSFLFV